MLGLGQDYGCNMPLPGRFSEEMRKYYNDTDLCYDPEFIELGS